MLIKDGIIVEIGDAAGRLANEELNAEECLVLPGFVNPHLHLDKALLGERINREITGHNESTSLASSVTPLAAAAAGAALVDEGLELAYKLKPNFTVSDVRERAVRVLREAVRYGTTAMRAFADVGTIGGLVPVEGLLRAREEMKDMIDLQIGAFPEEGLICDPGAEELLEEAMKMGADVVAGLPGFELTDADGRLHVDFCFDLAKRYARPLHLFIDPSEDPNSRNLEYLAVKILREGGHEGRVTVSWDALAAYNDVYATKIIALAKAAGINFVSTPPVALIFYGRVSRIQELLSAGVNIACGQDCVNDTYYPFGKPDQLEVAFFMSHVAKLKHVPDDLYTVIDMITVNAAKVLELQEYGCEVGCRADLVVLDAQSVHEALRIRSERRAVIKSGRLVAESRVETTLFG
jgi:cytosine deaminase